MPPHPYLIDLWFMPEINFFLCFNPTTSALLSSLFAPILAHCVFTPVAKPCEARIIWKMGSTVESIITSSVLKSLYFVLIVCLVVWLISITCNSRFPGLIGCWLFFIVVLVLISVSIVYVVSAVKSNPKLGGGPGRCTWDDVLWPHFLFLCQIASLHFLIIINTYVRRMVGPFIFRQKMDKVVVTKETLAQDQDSIDPYLYCPKELRDTPTSSRRLN